MKQRSKTPPPTPPGTQAVARAIAILKAMAGSAQGYGVTELSQILEINKAAVFRLLGALEAEGMVVKNSSGAYRLGPELITLGTSALGSTDLSAAAHEELVRLVEQTGETMTLEVLVGHETLIISEIMGHFILGGTPELGMRWPAHATSTGKVLLAFTPPHDQAPLTRRTPKTVVSRRELDRELAQVRAQGYAIAADELEVGFTALAAPVRNHFGTVVAAISVNGPTVRMTPSVLNEMVEPLRIAADRISRRLGATQEMLAVPKAPPTRESTTKATSARRSRTPATR